MGIFDYEVIQIDGDYAHLRNLDRPEDELKLVARALLPQEIQEGSRLHYECFEYTLTGIIVKRPDFSSLNSGENL